MKTIIKTKLYDFSIYLHEIENNSTFEIIAFCNSDKTKSSITNLNFIISELLQPITTIEDYESTIEIDKNIGNDIYNEAVMLFNDTDWLNYLFIKLEDDKNAGEWS